MLMEVWWFYSQNMALFFSATDPTVEVLNDASSAWRQKTCCVLTNTWSWHKCWKHTNGQSKSAKSQLKKVKPRCGNPLVAVDSQSYLTSQSSTVLNPVKTRRLSTRKTTNQSNDMSGLPCNFYDGIIGEYPSIWPWGLSLVLSQGLITVFPWLSYSHISEWSSKENSYARQYYVLSISFIWSLKINMRQFLATR